MKTNFNAGTFVLVSILCFSYAKNGFEGLGWALLGYAAVEFALMIGLWVFQAIDKRMRDE